MLNLYTNHVIYILTRKKKNDNALGIIYPRVFESIDFPRNKTKK